MKKIILLFLAAGILVACKDKNAGKEKNTLTKDDYSKTTTTGDKEAKKETGTETETGGTETVSNWPQSEKDGFMRSCENSAMKGGSSQELAESYCSCMMEKMEKKYPDINELIKLSEEQIGAFTDANKNDCLGKDK